MYRQPLKMPTPPSSGGEGNYIALLAAASALFGRASLDDLDPDTLAGVVAEVGGVELPGIGSEVSVVDLLERSGVVQSRGAARRARPSASPPW